MGIAQSRSLDVHRQHDNAIADRLRRFVVWINESHATLTEIGLRHGVLLDDLDPGVWSDANHSAAAAMSSSGVAWAIAVIRIGSFLFPLLKSFIVWMKYSGVRPWMSPDSGCPSPFIRWHDPHANPLFTLPSVTTRGAGACSLENQSGGAFRSSICGMV